VSSPTWIEIPSHGVFVYSERATASVPELCRAWIAALIEQLGVDPKALQISTKNSVLRWRKYSAKVVDEALADEQTRSIVLGVGAPSPVRLGARIQLRRNPMLWPSPWVTWLACDAERWPADVFVPVARQCTATRSPSALVRRTETSRSGKALRHSLPERLSSSSV